MRNRITNLRAQRSIAAARGGATRRAGGAFTLVEIMVVVILIGVLLSILVPSLILYRTRVSVIASMATIRALEGACDSYRRDFQTMMPSGADPNNSYPPSSFSEASTSPNAYNGLLGAELLPLFLIGYGPNPNTPGVPSTSAYNLFTDDGCEGPGFRLEARGHIFGPYNEADKLKMMTSGPSLRTNGNYHGGNVLLPCFVDNFDNPILYYRFNRAQNGYVTNDNPPDPGRDNIVKAMRGPADVNAYAQDGGGQFYRMDYLLITRGPDSLWAGEEVPPAVFLPPDPAAGQPAAVRSDDITNWK